MSISNLQSLHNGVWVSYSENWQGPNHGDRQGTFWTNKKTGEKKYQSEDPGGTGGGVQAQPESAGGAGAGSPSPDAMAAHGQKYAQQAREKFGDQAHAKLTEMTSKLEKDATPEGQRKLGAVKAMLAALGEEKKPAETKPTDTKPPSGETKSAASETPGEKSETSAKKPDPREVTRHAHMRDIDDDLRSRLEDKFGEIASEYGEDDSIAPADATRKIEEAIYLEADEMADNKAGEASDEIDSLIGEIDEAEDQEAIREDVSKRAYAVVDDVQDWAWGLEASMTGQAETGVDEVLSTYHETRHPDLYDAFESSMSDVTTKLNDELEEMKDRIDDFALSVGADDEGQYRHAAESMGDDLRKSLLMAVKGYREAIRGYLGGIEAKIGGAQKPEKFAESKGEGRVKTPRKKRDIKTTKKKAAGAIDFLQARGAAVFREGERREFSSTQFNLNGDIALAVREMSDSIHDADLHEEGREDKPHITVKFGLHTNNAMDVAKVVCDFGSVDVKFGSVSIFACEKYDVVKVDIESERLRELNRLISDSLECTDTHPEYKPHATLAYVKKGEGAKYVGDATLAGKTANFDALVFSDQDKEKLPIYLEVEGRRPVAASPPPA